MGGHTIVEHFESFLNAASLLGLAAQVAFAFFPKLSCALHDRAEREQCPTR
jgi:hypothetical protein